MSLKQIGWTILGLLLIATVFLPETSHAFGFSGSFSSGGGSGDASYANDMDQFGMEAVQFIKCSLQGNVGMIIIGVGVIMAMWEYFVQHRQMHVLYALLVVGMTIFLGAALPSVNGQGCSDGSSGSGWSIGFSWFNE